MSNEDILKDVSRGMPVSQADKEKFKDRIEKRTLLKILITDTKLLRDAVHITEESKFFEKYPVCSLFWRTLYDYYISNDGVFPSMEMLKNGVYINLDQWRLVFGEDELSKEEIQSFIKDLELYRNISREDQESNRTYFRNFFNEHLKFYARDAYNELLEKGYELEEAKEEFNRIVNSCVSEEPSHKNGMEGKSWEEQRRKQQQQTAEQVKNITEEGAQAVEAVEERVRNEVNDALRRIGVPHRDDIDELRHQVDALSEKMDRLTDAIAEQQDDDA